MLLVKCLGGGEVIVGDTGVEKEVGGDEDGDVGLPAKLLVSRFGSNISVRRLAGTGELDFDDSDPGVAKG